MLFVSIVISLHCKAQVIHTDIPNGQYYAFINQVQTANGITSASRVAIDSAITYGDSVTFSWHIQSPIIIAGVTIGYNNLVTNTSKVSAASLVNDSGMLAAIFLYVSDTLNLNMNYIEH